MRRWGPAIVGLAALGTVATGCGRSTVGYGTPEMAGRLAGTVRDVVQNNGYPVQDDHVGCTGHQGPRVIVCYGYTPDEPTTQIRATFVPSGPGCTGTLTVKLAGAALTPARTDPCT